MNPTCIYAFVRFSFLPTVNEAFLNLILLDWFFLILVGQRDFSINLFNKDLVNNCTFNYEKITASASVNSTMLDKTADGGNNAKKVGDKVAPTVAPDDDENQVGGKKVYCEFNVTNIKVLTGTGWSFLSAKYHCEKEGGFLATPKSVEDLYQFSRKPRKLFRNPQRNWVGAKENTSGKKNTWVWASGEIIPESFIGWLPGGGQGEGCLYYDLGEGGLNNVGCDEKIEGYLPSHIVDFDHLFDNS